MTLLEHHARSKGDWRDPARPVVVGIDDSGASDAAVAAAAREAAAEDRPLVLVTVVDEHLPAPGHTLRRDDPVARAALKRAARALRAEHPDLGVRRELYVGDRVHCLLHRSAESALVVVGSRHLGPLGRWTLGSTSIGVAGRSTVPVLVVPRRWDAAAHATADVAVAQASTTVLRRAFEIAGRRGARLHLFLETPEPHPVPRPLRKEFSDVPLLVTSSGSATADGLVAAGTDAQLLVVGRRGGSLLTGFAPGSPLRSFLHRTETPVLVVPAD